MSGINLWVIFGAIAVVLWQLADVFPTAMVSADTLLHALMATQAAYFGVIASTTPPFSRDELRLDPWLYSQPSSPVLSILEDLLLLLPPSAAYVLLYGWTICASWLLLLCIAFSIASAGTLVRLLRGTYSEVRALPRVVRFSVSTRVELAFRVLFVIVFISVAICEFLAMPNVLAQSEGNAAKCLTLVAVLYLLLLAAIRRGRMNLSREWTYRLEADLILGVVSTDTAISMIEHSRLGPRLQDVLDKHFTEIEEKYDAFERSIAEAASAIDDIRSIPEAYQAERKERARIAIDGPRKAFECVLKDSEDLTEFLKSAAMTMRVDSRVLAVIKKTIERSERNTERLRHAKERLFDLIKELYS